MKHGQRMTKARQRGDSAMQCVRSISLPQNAQFYPWDGNDLNSKYIARYPTSIKILATKSQLNPAKLSKCYSSKAIRVPCCSIRAYVEQNSNAHEKFFFAFMFHIL